MEILLSSGFQLKKADTASNHCKHVWDGQFFYGNFKECGYCICRKTVYGHGIIHIWDIKLKTTHLKTRKTNKNKTHRCRQWINFCKHIISQNQIKKEQII